MHIRPVYNAQYPGRGHYQSSLFCLPSQFWSDAHPPHPPPQAISNVSLLVVARPGASICVCPPAGGWLIFFARRWGGAREICCPPVGGYTCYLLPAGGGPGGCSGLPVPGLGLYSWVGHGGRGGVFELLRGTNGGRTDSHLPIATPKSEPNP